MGILALALYAVWIAFAGFGRMALQRQRTGDIGFHWPSGIEVPIAGVLLGAFGLGFGGAVAEALGLLVAIELPVWTGVLGAAVAVCGIALTVKAQLDMGASWRIGTDPEESTELVTSGLFRHVRNPIYTAMVVGQSGITLVVPNPATIAAVPLLVLALELQVRVVEEPFLRRRHGDDYAAYASRVGRFLPRVGRSGSLGR